MADYEKPWLTLDQQIDHLANRNVEVNPRDATRALLAATGYYRLTGYLYPFRESELFIDKDGQQQRQVLESYQPNTSIKHITQVIDFDRKLRMLVMEGVERIEIAVRMQTGYVLGRISPFAHLSVETFHSNFVSPQLDQTEPTKHGVWLMRVTERRDKSDEAFVAHFRDEYDNQMPIWALTELLELGQLSRLYSGLREDLALEITQSFDVPTKSLMASWLASINYARNVAAHHARFFNRKMQNAPKRPKPEVVPLLNHLREMELKSGFGAYTVLAVIAYLLRSIEGGSDWAPRIVALLAEFPETSQLGITSLGAPPNWSELELWS